MTDTVVCYFKKKKNSFNIEVGSRPNQRMVERRNEFGADRKEKSLQGLGRTGNDLTYVCQLIMCYFRKLRRNL